ncbi:phosphoribosylformylglycinamidine cyclo-ligase, partial [bacterium]|nr:phosphoribosylformylglycinamidine cyclo-ligase [bacterium]
HKTFNMGIGMVIAVKDAERALAFLKGAGEQALTLGAVVPFTGDSLSCSFV